MSKLTVDQKNIRDLFSDRKADFLIPDYQRPYAWDERECQTLWDDIFTFAFPDNDSTKFDSDSEEYFLGPIVTFKNENSKLEVIDGQQRLTTLMLLLRAFYDKFGFMKDPHAIKTKEMIEKCIWKTDEFGNPNTAALKIDSEVASDDDKQEFLNILRTGNATESNKSHYASNYRFFQNKIADFLNQYPSYFSFFPIRILNNCILLPIEAESQDTALRIFSTLNDRGKPLSDADIFKAQFYKLFTALNKKNEFIAKWKDLESLCEDIFHPIYGTPMDELFTRYMYYERAKLGIKSSTTEALRKFYEKDNYAILKKEETFESLIDLANFWKAIDLQDPERFSLDILRLLFILNYAPNGMWANLVSVYYMTYKDASGQLDEAAFVSFLKKVIGFVWTYAVTNPGVNALRTPIFAEMLNIINNIEVEFTDFKFEESTVRNTLSNYYYGNNRAITKSMITWWAFQDEQQELIPLETKLEIEHIFAKNRQEIERSLKNPKNIESLGNKCLLEKRVNIRASDYRFADKKKYYYGFTNSKGQIKEGTKIHELINLSDTQHDFAENDITKRNESILESFIAYLKDNHLLKE